MKHSKKDISSMGDIYQNSVNTFKLDKPVEEKPEAVVESEVIKNRRKKFMNSFKDVMNSIK